MTEVKWQKRDGQKKADSQKRRRSLGLTSRRHITGEQIQYKQNNKLGPALKRTLQFVICFRATDSTTSWESPNSGGCQSAAVAAQVWQHLAWWSRELLRFLGFGKVSGISAGNRQKPKASHRVGSRPQNCRTQSEQRSLFVSGSCTEVFRLFLYFSSKDLLL